MPGDFVFIGNVQSPEFQDARLAAENITRRVPTVKIEVRELFEMEWADELEEYQRNHMSLANHSLDQPLLWDRLAASAVGSMSDFRTWTGEKYQVVAPIVDAATLAHTADVRYRERLAARGSEFTFVEFDIPAVGKRRVVIELYAHVAPLTAANFRALCVGDRGHGATTNAKLHYVGAPVHRVMPSGYIQAGDICGGHGDGGESIYGGAFADETFDVRHTQRGIVGMAGGHAHANASQFYITLRPLPYLDTRCVAFGRAVSGLAALNAISAAECKNQRPVAPIVISACGLESTAPPPLVSPRGSIAGVQLSARHSVDSV